MRIPLLVLFAALASCASVAASDVHPIPAESREAALRRAADMLREVERDNNAFMDEHGARHFESFRDEQHPRAIVVACADSRFHIEAIDRSPDGDVFEIRNIGNQVDSSAGSVEYGVRHLQAPLLLVIGHVGCGAVHAAMEDYGGEPPAIRREIDGLHLSIFRTGATGTFEQRWLANVVGNVHQQVADALSEYADEIRTGRLHVVGAVYDFRGDLGGRRGALHVVNVNGERNPAALAATPLLRQARGATPVRQPR